MQRKGDVLYGILDSNTGEWFTYDKVTTWIDGSAMTPEKCDRVIYIDPSSYPGEYFRRRYSGPPNVRWFGAKGDGITNDTPAFQKAIDTFQIGGAVGNGTTIFIPPGKYLLANLIMKTGTVLFADQQVAKDNYIANVPVTIAAYGTPDYIIDTDLTATNCGIFNIYVEGDFENQPQLIAGVRLRGQKFFFIGNNINACAQAAVWNECGLVFVEKCGIHGWYGDAPTFNGINDFKGGLHCPAVGDSYIYDNEVSAGLKYFTSTVNPRDPINGRIVALSLGNIFGGTSVISGNLFENGDRAVAIGNSLYCNFHNNRYELSAMGGLYIYGPMQFATFSQERFADNSLSVDGAADDITIATGAGGNISFVVPTFESLFNVAIPNSTFKVNYHISNYGSDLIDIIAPVVDSTYSVNGLVNLSDITNLPVRQVKGQYHPDDPQYTSVSTQKLPAETQVGYVKMKQGTDAATQSLVGALEFWTPQGTIAYSLGFSPKEYLSLSGYEPGAIFALNIDTAIQKNGAAKLTVWSIDGAGNSQIVLQGNPLVTTQGLITLNNTTSTLSIVSSGNIDLGSNVNFRLNPNGTTTIVFAPNSGLLSDSFILGRNTTSGDIVTLNSNLFSPATGGTGYIQNQTAVAQTGEFRITGNGIIGSRLNIGADTIAAYPLQVAAEAGISAQFIGRIIIADATGANDAVAYGQLTASARAAISGTSPVSYNSSTGVISMPAATSGAGGYLAAVDWNTFNNKIGSLNALTATTQTFAVGTTGTDFNIVSSGSVHTFHVPDASATNRGVVTIGAQTFAGTKTFSTTIVGTSITLSSVTSNIYLPASSSISAVTNAIYLFAGASTIYLRSALGGGNTAGTLAVGSAYASTVIGRGVVTEAASGTHPLIAGLVVTPPTVTAGAATVTLGATLYIESATAVAGGTPNWAIYVNTGDTSLQNVYIAAAAYTTGGYLQTVRNVTTGRLETITAGSNVVEVTGTSQSAVVNTEYFANNAGLVTITLPASAIMGDKVSIRGKGAGGWKLGQNSGQVIHGATSTTTGTGGSVASSAQYNTVTVECMDSSGTSWIIISSQGTLTIT